MRVAVAGSTIPWGATSPVVPATGDVILLGGTYEKN
jgi:hypothetical protein